MLVSHIHRFIYLKTRKTAGTSTEMALEPFCRAARDVVVTEKTEAIVSEAGIVGARLMGKPGRGSDERMWRNHMSATEIRAAVGDDVWSSYLKIANIRNPWDKVVSRFFRRQANKGCGERPFDEQIETFRRQVATGEIIREDWDVLTIDDEIILDRVIRHSQLERDLHAIVNALGLPLPELTNAKSGFRPPEAASSKLYDDASRDRVGEAFRREVDLFGWVFDQPEPTKVAGTSLDPTMPVDSGKETV